jgi:hypothetical protein
VIYGNEAAEAALLRDMVRDAEEGIIRTVVLFPTDTAKHVADSYADMCAALRKRRESGIRTHEDEEEEEELPSFRLVALESSYSKAHRMFRMLLNGMKAHGFPLPVAKLEVADGEVLLSAFHGVMRQPAPDKVSTYQAVVMSLRQIAPVLACQAVAAAQHPGIDKRLHALCNFLDEDLTTWLSFLLRSGVKKGKVKGLKTHAWQEGLDMPEELKAAMRASAYHGDGGRARYRVYEKKSFGKGVGHGGEAAEVTNRDKFDNIARREAAGTGAGNGMAPLRYSTRQKILRRAVEVVLKLDGSLTQVTLTSRACNHSVPDSDGGSGSSASLTHTQPYFLTLRKSKRFRVLGLVPVAHVTVECDLHTGQSPV